MKKIFLLLFSIIYITSCKSLTFQNGFYMYKNGNNKSLIFLNLLDKQTTTDSWSAFENAAFTIVTALEYAKNESLPFFLVINDVFFNISQLDEKAPWLEGSRVALAWASSYFRFTKEESFDVRAVIINNELTDHELLNALNKLHTISFLDKLEESPEERIQKRIFSLEQLVGKKSTISELSSSLDYIQVPSSIQNTTLIKHTLNHRQKNKKRFLITGVAGFIASHIARALLKENHQVIGLDNCLCCTGKNIQDLLVDQNFYFQQHDITEPFSVNNEIDCIMHFASVPSPAFYYTLPIETLKSGLHGTKNCLDLAVSKKAQFIFASTSEVYGDPEITPQPENYCGRVSPIGKRSQYDMSKRGAETLIKLYFDKYKIDARIARIFNTYGPGMLLNDGRVVTNFIQAILENKPMYIYGDGQQTRSFAYVSDTVDGIMKIIKTDNITTETPLFERIFNIGNSDEFTINELAKQLNTIAQENSFKPVSIVTMPQFDITDPKMRCPDLDRAQTILHFYPKVKLTEGLRRTLDYFESVTNLNIDN